MGQERVSTAIQEPAPSAPLSAIHALAQVIGRLLSASFLTSCKWPVDDRSELKFIYAQWDSPTSFACISEPRQCPPGLGPSGTVPC